MKRISKLVAAFANLKICSFLLAAALFLPQLANARQGGNFGLGVILGAPTAITGKYYMNREEAIDMGLAFDFDDYILVYGDYLVHFPGGFGHSSQFASELVPYVGIGPVLVLDADDRRRNDKYFADANDDFGLGVRIPLGIEWMAPRFPLGIAVEIVPGIIVIPGTDAFVQGGVAFRYYF
jgi:hypothetical protein